MSLRIISTIIALSTIAFSAANAQLLARDTAAGDSQQEFAKRVSSVRNDAISTSVREAEKTGWNIYRYEVLSDLAGAFLAQQTPPDKRAGISGSIVVNGAKGWSVRFYSVAGKGMFKPVADVVFDEDMNPGLKTGTDLADFSPAELASIGAKVLIDTQKEDPCQGNYKMFAIPASSGDSIWVYQIRESFDETHFPEGQHIRYEISPDGSRILSQRDYSRRCNVLPVQKSSDNVSSEVKLTNTIDQQPTEMLVYLSLRYNTSIFVATMQSNLYWQVKSGVVTPD